MAKKKWTVLLMQPDDIRADQCCAADEVVRTYVNAATAEEAFSLAQNHWATLNQRDPDDYAVIAIYRGHLFDHFTP